MASFRPWRAIPNFITLLNLLSGSLGILAAFEGNLVLSGYLIGLSAILDFFDGFAARLLGAYSQIGKELDSLADMVSFGLLPALILYQMVRQGLGLPSGQFVAGEGEYWLLVIPFSVAAFSALRLAKFNIDARQSTDFIGLPTPASALLVASLPIIQGTGTDSLIGHALTSPISLLVLSVLLSVLMVSEIPMFSLKFKNLSLNENAHRFIFLLLSLVLLVFLRWSSVPLIIGLYVLFSLFLHLVKGTKGQAGPA